MAFYNPPFYHTDLTHYDSYDSYYDTAQTQPPISQSSNEPTFYNLFDYPPPTYFGQAYDSGVGVYRSNFNEYEPVDHEAYGGYSISYSANACSASSFSVPKVIEYDPNFDLYGDDFQKVSTQFVISYSVSEFNETDFEEYDPTPYGGGYDISETYGKPLQPSIEICYSPSSSSPPKPPPPSSAAVAISKGSIEEAPKGRIEEQTTPSSEIKPTQIEKDNDSSSSESDDTASESEEKTEEIQVIPLADPGIGYGNGREINQIPSGYGLEAMDLCETLFGYWPCLSRTKRQTPCRQPSNGCGRCHGHCYCYGNYGNQWQPAADYLFGSNDPYRDRRGQGDAVYGYQRQNQMEPVYGYVWLNEINRTEDV